ncbi:MAG TPA: TetR/AcrR family transcriptional regulator, partial [Burkholderiaceae bacterium]
HIETQLQEVLEDKTQAIRGLVNGMSEAGHLAIDPREVDALAQSMVVVLTYWLSYEYVREPRKALEPDQAGATLARGAWHVLSLLTPYLEPAAREHLQRLAGAYKS